MMLLPAWLWITSPLKFVLWLGNRIATWTGAALLWKRRQSRRRFWLSLIALNLISFGVLALVFFWLSQHHGHPVIRA